MDRAWSAKALPTRKMFETIPSADNGTAPSAYHAQTGPTSMSTESAEKLTPSATLGINSMDDAFPASEDMTSLIPPASSLPPTLLLLLMEDARLGIKEFARNAPTFGCSTLTEFAFLCQANAGNTMLRAETVPTATAATTL